MSELRISRSRVASGLVWALRASPVSSFETSFRSDRSVATDGGGTAGSTAARKRASWVSVGKELMWYSLPPPRPFLGRLLGLVRAILRATASLLEGRPGSPARSEEANHVFFGMCYASYTRPIPAILQILGVGPGLVNHRRQLLRFRQTRCIAPGPILVVHPSRLLHPYSLPQSTGAS